MANKKQAAGASTTSPSKTSAKKDKLDQANVKKQVANVVAERLTKYRYPEDVTTKEQRKAFRRNARAAKSKLEKEIKELSASKEKDAPKALKTKQAEMATFEQATYLEKAAV